MKNFLNKLINNVIAQQSGDIVALHKGSLSIPGSKESSASPKAVLRSAIRENRFSGKPLLVPDVSKFDLTLKGFNPALLGVGLQSRLGSDIKLQPNRNRRINRYLTVTYLRLLKLAELKDWGGFVKTSSLFICRSNSYLIASLVSIKKNLYREVGMKRLRLILMQINDLRATTVKNKIFKKYLSEGNLTGLMAHVMKFHRTYIPKANGKTRPLGVPDLAWRVYTKMWLLPIQLMNPVDSFQHGFIPRRGTMTAWNKLSTEVINSRNVFEVDFEGFFPSVQPETISRVANLTPKLAEFLKDLNESKPAFGELAQSMGQNTPETLYTEESLKALYKEFTKLQARGIKNPAFGRELKRYVQHIMMLLARRTKIPATAAKLNLPRLDKKTFSLLVSQQFNPLNHVQAIANFIPIPTGYPTRNAAMRAWLHEVLRSRQVIVNDYNLPLGTVEIQFERYEATQRALEEQKSRLVHSGLPQGSPLSPFLSILVLNHVYKLSQAQFPNVGWLFYADDGMFYSNHDQEFQAFLQWIPKALGEFGISISKEKSQLAVLYNRPVVERTKFLGIVFEHESGKIYSETRSGKSLLYTYKDIVAFSAQLRDNKEEIEKSFGINPYENTHSILYLFLLWKMETWEPNKRSLFFARFISRLDSTQKKAVQRFIELDTSALAKAMRFTLKVKDPFKESKVMLNSLFEKVKSLTEVKTGLFSGPFGGLIQSRIYGGSETVAAFDTASGSQDFVLRVIPNSLGHVLKSKIPEHINLHNGSSYASGEMVRLLGSIVKGKKKPVLRGGPVLAPH